MNIDRYMVNLFFEIKRNIPHEQQRDMKISNPNIGAIMAKLYRTSEDQNIKLLTSIFLERAGDDWSTSIQDNAKKNWLKRFSSNKQNARESELMPKPKKSQRIYRGQVVED